MEDDKLINRIIIGVVVFLGLILSLLLFRIYSDVQRKQSYSFQEKDKKNITIWTIHGDIQTILEEVVKKYETEDISFEITSFKNEVYQSTIQSAAITNQLPDIFFAWGYGWLEKYVKFDLVVDITDVVEETGLKEKCLPYTLEGVTYDDKLYAMPTYGWNVSLFCNEELFRVLDIDYPTTYDEFIEVIKAFKAEGMVPLAGSMKEEWVNSLYYMSLVLGEGELQGVYDAALNHKKFNTPQFYNAAKKMQEINGLMPWQSNYIEDDGYDACYLFTQGKSAMLLYGSWAASSIEAEDSKVKDIVKVIPFPNENTRYGVGGFVDTFVISKNGKISEDKELQLLYLQIMQDVSQLAIDKYGIGLPAYKGQEINKAKFPTMYACSTIKPSKGQHPAYDQLFGEGKGQTYYRLLRQLINKEIDAKEFTAQLAKE